MSWTFANLFIIVCFFFFWNSYGRMYQAFLACGDHKSAATLLHRIPKDDPHVCCVIEACQTTYAKSSVKSKEKKKKEKMEEDDRKEFEKEGVN